MNPGLRHLSPYPFARLTELLQGVSPPPALAPLNLSVGEPGHPAPAFALDVLRTNLADFSRYPPTRGLKELRTAAANWATRRYSLPAGALNPDTSILPVAGTREGTFSLLQALAGRGENTGPGSATRVAIPNPSYQIYRGAALLAGAEPWLLPCQTDSPMPDYDAVAPATWDSVQLLIVCSPDNPTGRVTTLDTFGKLLELARRHDFIIVSDECYGDIYPNEAAAPPGLLQSCIAAGYPDFNRCLVLQSLSKRSNLPGLRSGFVAGNPELLAPYALYRSYHGCSIPLPCQRASIAAWNDDEHARINRDLYREKFAAVTEILAPATRVESPQGGFYLWLPTPGCDREFTRELFIAQGVQVLPGSFMGIDTDTGNPGAGFVRMALVAPLAECAQAATRLRDFLQAGGGAAQ